VVRVRIRPGGSQNEDQPATLDPAELDLNQGVSGIFATYFHDLGPNPNWRIDHSNAFV
jgi:hypothetical protein